MCLSLAGHSLQYYHTAVSVPELGLWEYVSVGYVEGIEIVRYSSDVGRAAPVAQWMKKVENPDYWEKETKNCEVQEEEIEFFLNKQTERLNHTQGYRIVHVTHGCELKDDGSSRSYARLGYGGKDYLELDRLNSNVTYLTNEAQRIADTLIILDGSAVEQMQVYLQTDCIDWLRECVGHGKELLNRTVPPEVKNLDQTVNGVTKLHCQVHGFYPQEVDMKWKKDEIVVPSNEAKHVLPNSDGTLQIRVTVEVLAEDREGHSCLEDQASFDRSFEATVEGNGWSLTMKIGTGVGVPAGGSIVISGAIYLYIIRKRIILYLE
uniref:Ig-like domain-containing protein n=1 Tax=Leptobrachium leishanense TaxID=445787 RepID=A0A8C5MM38_9ANUR